MTRVPRSRDSATFSAACRHTLQVRNRPSPSFHSFACLSKYRGVEAIRNRATALPGEQLTFGGVVTGILVGMEFLRELAIGLFQVGRARTFFNPEDFVQITHR